MEIDLIVSSKGNFPIFNTVDKCFLSLVCAEYLQINGTQLYMQKNLVILRIQTTWTRIKISICSFLVLSVINMRRVLTELKKWLIFYSMYNVTITNTHLRCFHEGNFQIFVIDILQSTCCNHYASLLKVVLLRHALMRAKTQCSHLGKKSDGDLKYSI